MLKCVDKEIKKRKLKVVNKEFGLTKHGARMFGVLTLEAATKKSNFALALGIRSSIDRSLSQAVCVGGRVFVCDNLAFSAEIVVRAKNTMNIMDRLPGAIAKAFDQTGPYVKQQEAFYKKLRSTEVDDSQMNDLVIAAAYEDIIPSSQILPVCSLWDDPLQVCETKQERAAFKATFGKHTGWRAFNAFTYQMKQGYSVNMVTHEAKTRTLVRLFKENLLGESAEA